MQDIADRLKITKMSVSKALRGSEGVSEKLRAEILAAATEMGYDVKRAKNTPFLKDYHFAFVVRKRFFEKGEDFYTKIYHHLSDRCLLNGCSLTLFVLYEDFERDCRLPEAFRPEKYDGIFIGGQVDKVYFFLLENLKKPVVAIDFYYDESVCDCVLSDNFYMGYSATNHLIKNGHRDIGFLGVQPMPSSVQDRFYGYMKALREHGIEYDPARLMTNYDAKASVHTVHMRLPDRLPDAFVCDCDMAAYYLSLTLKAVGRGVPDGVSLISFDDTAIAAEMRPRLSTFNIDKAAFAGYSFEQMTRRLADPSQPFRRVYVPVHLKLRDSVRDMNFFKKGVFDWQLSGFGWTDGDGGPERFWGGFPREVPADYAFPDWALAPAEKYAGNPVFAPDAASWDCGNISGGVHNGSVLKKDGLFWYIYRGEMPFSGKTREGRALNVDYVCDIGLASSADGVRFTRRGGPLFRAGEEPEISFEDVCCVERDGTYYLFCNRWDWKNPSDPAKNGVYLAVSSDLLHWEKKGLVFPDARRIHRNACVLQNTHNRAVAINGEYIMYINDGLAAVSRDLIRWESRETGAHWPGGEGCFALTDHGGSGDIVLFTGGHHTGRFYAVGEALFKRDAPFTCRDYLLKPVLAADPSIPYESGFDAETGKKQISRWRDTVFFTGLTEHEGKLRLYYGGGEYYTCLAEIRLKGHASPDSGYV